MPSSRAAACAQLMHGPSSGWAPALQLLVGAQYAPLLWQHDQLGSAPGRLANESIGGFEVAIRVLGRVELNRTDAQGTSLHCWNTSIDRSVNVPLKDTPQTALPYRGAFGAPRPPELSPLALPPHAMPSRQGLRPLKAWRYVGVFGPERDGLRGGRPDRCRRARRSGRSGTAPLGRLHERTAIGRGNGPAQRRPAPA